MVFLSQHDKLTEPHVPIQYILQLNIGIIRYTNSYNNRKDTFKTTK